MKYLGIMLVLFLVCSHSWANHSVKIMHNPFEYADEKKSVQSRKSGYKNKANTVVKPRPWRPKLVATIAAGDHSMANVAGKIVKVGQRIDGYTLISVDRKTATFEKSGSRYVLKMAKKIKTK